MILEERMIVVNSKKLLAKITIACGGIVGATWIANKIIFAYATMKKLLVNQEEHIYPWRFGNIYYKKRGNGSPLLLIHDLNSASSGYEWDKIIDELAKKHTVYALDLLGCGHSEKPRMTYTNYLYVQLINDFIKDVIKGKTDILVSGTSSAFVIMACYMDSDLYHKIIFINPENPIKVEKSPDLLHKLYKYTIETPIIGTFIYNMRNAFFAINYNFKKKYFGQNKNISKELIDIYHESAHLGGNASRFLYASIRSRYINVPIRRAIKSIDQSMVIIAGTLCESMIMTVGVYENLNPSIEIEWMDGCKYLPQLENPEKLLELLDIHLATKN